MPVRDTLPVMLALSPICFLTMRTDAGAMDAGAMERGGGATSGGPGGVGATLIIERDTARTSSATTREFVCVATTATTAGADGASAGAVAGCDGVSREGGASDCCGSVADSA